MRGKMWKMTMEIRGNDAGTRDFIHSSGGGVVMSLPASQLPIVSTIQGTVRGGGDDATTLFDARTPPPSCCSPLACARPCQRSIGQSASLWLGAAREGLCGCVWIL